MAVKDNTHLTHTTHLNIWVVSISSVVSRPAGEYELKMPVYTGYYRAEWWITLRIVRPFSHWDIT